MKIILVVCMVVGILVRAKADSCLFGELCQVFLVSGFCF